MGIMNPIFVNPAKIYDFNTHKLSVDKVSLNSAHRTSDGVVRVSLAVYGGGSQEWLSCETGYET